jgi:hypothetical protein
MLLLGGLDKLADHGPDTALETKLADPQRNFICQLVNTSC